MITGAPLVSELSMITLTSYFLYGSSLIQGIWKWELLLLLCAAASSDELLKVIQHVVLYGFKIIGHCERNPLYFSLRLST